jgi:hypothetical protein
MSRGSAGHVGAADSPHASLLLQAALMQVMITMRMVQSDIDSPCSRNLCSQSSVAASISIRQLPFRKRRPGGGSNTLAIRARHSSVISVSGIV